MINANYSLKMYAFICVELNIRIHNKVRSFTSMANSHPHIRNPLHVRLVFVNAIANVAAVVPLSLHSCQA